MAQEQHVNVVKRALSDVAVYLSGARWEVQHRNAVAFPQLQVMTRTDDIFSHKSQQALLALRPGWGKLRAEKQLPVHGVALTIVTALLLWLDLLLVT